MAGIATAKVIRVLFNCETPGLDDVIDSVHFTLRAIPQDATHIRLFLLPA
jgi:hypothetical protein